ncbi:hypothetical protein D9619_004479 [Psilocybe cf. subviscida]|uniref:Decapping nuclease n=1 Tax=Psilocybe cf. subviscida TaxID=2480587 RepID=A0A8H5F7U8_9AGAR|nr:hypothetical protein D9619_004479 [Psilocybe cf. subviscida]
MPSSPSHPSTVPTSHIPNKRRFEDSHEQDNALNTEAASDLRPTNRQRLPPKPPASLPPKPAFAPQDMDSRLAPSTLGPHPVSSPTTSDPLDAIFLPYPPLQASPAGSSSRVPFQQPSPVISFSYTPVTHTQKFDDSALKAFVDPPPGADLNYGYERWLRKPDERGRLDGLLNAVQIVKEKEAAMALAHDQGKGKGKEIGAVAWRGVITKILTAPYEERDGWELNAMLVNGTLYLEEHLTEAKLKDKNNMDARNHKQSYYGYAFESYCTKPIDTNTAAGGSSNDGRRHPPGWSGDVDTNEQWCSVVRTKLGDVRLVVGGEVDCVRGKYTGNSTDRFVELKTSMSIRGPQDEGRFEKKLLKFYFQSFLLGVPEIVVGFRTPAGRLTTTQSFRTMELPRMVRGKPGAWDPQVCLEWGWKVLAALRAAGGSEATGVGSTKEGGQGTELHGSEGGDRRVWRATFTPGKGVRIRLLDEEELKEVASDGEHIEDGKRVERIGFLPKWYWEAQYAGDAS